MSMRFWHWLTTSHTGCLALTSRHDLRLAALWPMRLLWVCLASSPVHSASLLSSPGIWRQHGMAGHLSCSRCRLRGSAASCLSSDTVWPVARGSANCPRVSATQERRHSHSSSTVSRTKHCAGSNLNGWRSLAGVPCRAHLALPFIAYQVRPFHHGDFCRPKTEDAGRRTLHGQ
jgi:hypothetical protein